MTTVVLSFAGVPNTNPYPVQAGFTDRGAATAAVSSNEWTGNNSSANTLWECNTNPSVDSYSVYITSGAAGANARGFAFFNSSGNGFMFIARSTDIRVFALATYALSGTALATYGITLSTNDVIRCDITQSTGTYVVKQNGTTRGTFINTTYTSGLVSGILSRAGNIKDFTLEYTPAYSVTSINGGSPFTASQTASSAVTTGFTGLPTSITSNVTGLTFSNIGGTTNAPTFNKSVRTDGAVYPKDGVTATVTFTKGSETASITIACNKDADETEVIVASPINDDVTTLFGAIFAATGRSAASGDEVYHKIPSAMLTNGVDTISPADAISPNGEMQFYNAGTFTCWVWTNATGVNYYYSVTITESGEVVIPPTTRPLGGRPIRSSIGRQIWSIVPHATNPVGGSGSTKKAYGIKVSGAGTVVLRTENGDEDVTVTLAAGATLPVVVTHIRDTSTATGILGYSIF